MARIAGIDIPVKKKIYYALQYVHGIGPKYAADILAEANIDPKTRTADLTDQDVAQINAIVDASFVALTDSIIYKLYREGVRAVADAAAE